MLNITFFWAKFVFDDHKLQCISLKQKESFAENKKTSM
jgi:hypothetical protein